MFNCYAFELFEHAFNQRTLTVGGRITVQLVSSLTILDLTDKENKLFCM